MNNVNDLNKTDITKAPPTQTVSLNAVRRPQPTSNINIDTTNGLTGVESNQSNETTGGIRIDPNLRKRPRRTVERPSDVKQVNPNDFIRKEVRKEADFRTTMQENAMSQLDATVRRKQQEFHDFIKYAEEADKTNREKIDNGLEKIEGEVDYMPAEVSQKEKEEESNKSKEKEEFSYSEPVVYEDDDVEKDLEAELNSDQTGHSDNIKTTVTVSANPFGFEEDTFSNPYAKEFEQEKEPTPASTVNDNDDLFNDEEYEDDFSEDEIFNDEKEESESIVEEEVFTPIDSKETPFGEEEKAVEVESIKEKEPTKSANIIDKTDEEIRNTLMDRAISVSSSIKYDTETTKNTISNSSSSDFEIDEEDFDDVNSTEDSAQTEEDAVALSSEEIEKIRVAGEKNLKNEILKKIINTGKKLDATQFTISTKIIPIKDAIRNRTTEVVKRTAKWPMMYSERPFIASALKGPEIALLFDYDDSSNENSIGITQQQLKIMYEHDANEFKPATIENWAKTIPFLDIESIFAALYLASMKGSNYLPMACREQKCQHQYLTDNIDIDKIVKYPNDTIKAKFNEIMAMNLTSDNTAKYESVVNVINEDFAIGLKIPSIFTMVYELNSVDRPFMEKYNTIISIIQYIDYIYKINHETMSFEPIGWKAYVGNYGKTFKSKIATYAKILKDLDSKEFSVLIALINSMLTKATETRMVEYEIPAGKCPKCGAEIAAVPLAPRQLLFMQQRLVELATTPTERS